MRRWGMTGKQLEFTSFYAAAKDDCLRIVLVTVGNRPRMGVSVRVSYRFWRRYHSAALSPADATMIRPRM